MKAVIAEKPSVARDLARVLGATNRRDGSIQGNGYWITWAFGHLIRLSDPDAYGNHYRRWTLDTLPILPAEFITEVPPNTKDQFEIIASIINHTDVTGVICATDAGREGELIFRYIYEKSGCQKPIERLWISSQTDEAIRTGFSNLRPGTAYVPLFQSALARTRADWVIGMNATRAYSCRFGSNRGILSVGRVQTPVLKMIVDRYIANTQFDSVAYAEIQATFRCVTGTYIGIWIDQDNESKQWDLPSTHALKDRLATPPSPPVVLSVTINSKSEKPPLLYDLTELQKDANRKFQFSADHTLKLAQSLYETHKILTYPRTSSRYLSTDLAPKLTPLVHLLAQVAPVKDAIQTIIDNQYTFNKRFIDSSKVSDHHAIIPTEKRPNLSQLSPDETAVYLLVVRRFLSAFFPDCKKKLTEIITSISEERFRTAGTKIIDPGWRSIDAPETIHADELPTVRPQEIVALESIECVEKKTKAPPLHTEASLLAAMETAGKRIDDDEMRQAMKDCGLGTPATRAQILERLITVGYVVRDKQRLVPTEKGQELISWIQDPALISPELTGEWEKKLQDIAKSTYDYTQFMAEIYQFATTIITQVRSCEIPLTPQLSPNGIGSCPVCGSSIVENTKAYGCLNWRAGCGFKIWKTIASRPIDIETAKTLLTEKKIATVSGFKSKTGSPFSAGMAVTTDGIKLVF